MVADHQGGRHKGRVSSLAAASISKGHTMKLARGQFLHLAAGAAALPAASRLARAQTDPTRPIRLVAPSPPGGVVDFIARPLAQRLKPVLGTVFIENVGGGGGSLGSALVALQLRTLGSATVASATGQLLPFTALSKAREMM
jgi:tripartite-type tricarboxylate transporter receptor subunit TctC